MYGTRRALLSDGYTTAARVLFAAMTVQPSRARMRDIDDLIARLQNAGIWSQIDLLHVYAAHDSGASLLNWRNPAQFAGVTVNDPTFAVDRGWTGNGTSSRIRTGYTPSTGAINYAQNSASVWVWSLTDAQNDNYDIGNHSGVQARILTRSSTGNMAGVINDATATGVAVTDSLGLYGAQRRGASDKRYWKNGAQVGSTLTTASTGVPSAEQWVGAANGALFSSKQIAMAAYGASLSGLEAAFYGIVRAYLARVGAV